MEPKITRISGSMCLYGQIVRGLAGPAKVTLVLQGRLIQLDISPEDKSHLATVATVERPSKRLLADAVSEVFEGTLEDGLIVDMDIRFRQEPKQDLGGPARVAKY